MKSLTAEKIVDLHVKRFNESFVMVNREGCIVDMGGDWQALGISGVKVGETIINALPAFVGMFPFRDPRELMSLPLLQVAEDRYIDLLIEPDEQGIVVLARDVSDKARVLQGLTQKRNELHWARDTLEKMTDELTQSLEELQLLYALVNHEIRNAAQNVRASVELFSTAQKREDRQRYCSFALATSQHLLHIVSEMLQTSRVAAEKATVSIQPHDFVQRIVRDFTPQALVKGLEMKFTCGADVPERIEIDEKKLQLVLTNLIGNAVKFTVSGVVHVHLDKGVYRDRPMLNVSIEDTGPGFTPEQLDRAFQPFVSFPRRNAEKQGGAGLGLFISKRMAIAMGGHIKVKSKPSNGSCFSVRIPVCR